MLIAIHIDQCMFWFHWQKQGPIYFDAFQEFFFLITCVTVSFICKEFKHHICKIRVVFLNVGLEIGENGANVFLFLSLFHWTSMSFCFFFWSRSYRRFHCQLSGGWLFGCGAFLFPFLLFLAFHYYQPDFHYYYNCLLALKHYYKVPYWNQCHFLLLL